MTADTITGGRGEGRVVTVTGGATGIGRAACDRLLADGFPLAMLDPLTRS